MVIEDQPQPILDDRVVGCFEAHVVSVTGRTFNTTERYRYGFNGKEEDSEGMGGGLSTYDYGFRIYNPALAKFLSVDPLFKSFPWNGPFSFAENSPIEFIDLDGAEKYDYKMQMTDLGEIKMELIKQTDIIERKIVGHRIISYGTGAETPIYETVVNPRKAYTINGSNASERTVNELSGREVAAPLVQAGIDKIKGDYAINKGQFSENYNITFGKFLFQTAFKEVQEKDYVTAALNVWETVDTETWKNGSSLFFLYDNFVRQNDNTGHDKLLHFTASAYYTMAYGKNTSYGLGLSKEIFKDWLMGEGFDDNDMRANSDGISYGKMVNNAVEKGTGEIEFCNYNCE